MNFEEDKLKKFKFLKKLSVGTTGRIDLYQNRVVAEMKERKEINRRRRGEK